MPEVRHISLKVCGNPQANSGFMPLILFNSPSIDIVDAFYTGFDANSYFFSVKVERMQVIYKLMKNNVRSNGSVRAGSLVIAFSIPRGYKLDQGYDPYDVMMSLKNKFLNTYMTCRDKTNDTWEINAEPIDPAPLEETAKQFTLIPGTTPFFPMTEGGPVGCITCPEDRIEMLLKDIQCRNFSRFSEVVIAETASGTNYTTITGLQIPRMPEYTIIVDNEKKGIITDTSQAITVKPQVNAPQFYDIHELTFTIDQLINRDRIENVTLDEETETVHVSTASLAVKKSKTLKLQFQNNEQANYFFTNKNACRLTYQGKNIPLGNNYEFILMGEELALLSNPSGLKFECGLTDKYLVSGIEYRPGDDKITVKAVNAPKPTDMMPVVSSNTVNAKNPNVTDVVYKFPNLDMFGDNDELQVWIGRTIKTKPQQVKTSVRMSRNELKGKHSNEFTGHVFIPSDWNKYELYTKISTLDGKKMFETQSPLKIKNNTAEVGFKDLYPVNTSAIGRFIKSNKLLTAIIAALLCCLLGAAIGFLLHDPITQTLKKGDSTNKETIKDNNKPSDPVNTDNNKPNDDSKENTTSTFTDEEALGNLNTFKATLSQQGLLFTEVDDIFNQYQEHQEQYKNLDENTSQLIETYHEVVDFIKQGDAENIRKYCYNDNKKYKNQLNYRHHKLVYEALVGYIDGNGKTNNYSNANKKKAEQYFKTHYTSYTAFRDLEIPAGMLNLQNVTTKTNTISNKVNSDKNSETKKTNNPQNTSEER